MIDLALAILVVTLLAYHILMEHAWSKERAQLLDRLMSRSWGEYISGTRTVDQPETPQLTTDEAEQAWYAAEQRMLEAS